MNKENITIVAITVVILGSLYAVLYAVVLSTNSRYAKRQSLPEKEYCLQYESEYTAKNISAKCLKYFNE